MSANDISIELKCCDVYLKTYHLDDICMNEMKEFKSEGKVFLILTNMKSLSNYEKFVQIQFIYILNEQHKIIQFNKKDHPKLIDVFENMNDLIDRLHKDLILTYRNDLPISICLLNEIKKRTKFNN